MTTLLKLFLIIIGQIINLENELMKARDREQKERIECETETQNMIATNKD